MLYRWGMLKSNSVVSSAAADQGVVAEGNWLETAADGASLDADRFKFDAEAYVFHCLRLLTIFRLEDLKDPPNKSTAWLADLFHRNFVGFS